jgi:hypothetical protein
LLLPNKAKWVACNAACFFYHKGTVLYEFTPEEDMFECYFYLVVHRCMQGAITMNAA